MKNSILCIILILFSCAYLLFFLANKANGEIPPGTRQMINNAEKSAIDWLKSQMVPNDVVKLPAPDRRRLILSYAVPPDDPVYKYIAPRSFIYDDAVAIVAFTMAGEIRSAEAIINTLWRLQRDDGSFYFTYNTHNSWPNEDDNEGAIIRTGALAWVGFATVYYLNAMLEKYPDFIKKDIIGERAFEVSRKLADFMVNHQVNDKESPLYGLITGGYGEYVLKIEDGKLVERFNRAALNWASSEHNIDAYFFLRDFGRLTENEKYLKSAEKITLGLSKLWSTMDGQFYRGIKGDGKIDRALPLDCASWAEMYLIAIGDMNRARKTLNTIEAKYRISRNGLNGYRPYASGPIYEDPEVNRYFKSQLGFNTWEKSDLIWIEGNMGVAAAFYKAGDKNKAQDIVKWSLQFQNNGGFLYANKNIPYHFNSYPSVASTGWFIILAEIMKSEKKNRSFWDK